MKMGDRVRVRDGHPDPLLRSREGSIYYIFDSFVSRFPVEVEFKTDAGGFDYGRFREEELQPVEFESFSSGAVRDTQEGKPRYDLISPKFLYRMAMVLTEAAGHYGDHNWHKGIPTSRSLSSLMRHVESVRQKKTDEDHLGRIACNVMFMMEFEDTELDDRYDWEATLHDSD